MQKSRYISGSLHQRQGGRFLDIIEKQPFSSIYLHD